MFSSNAGKHSQPFPLKTIKTSGSSTSSKPTRLTVLGAAAAYTCCLGKAIHSHQALNTPLNLRHQRRGGGGRTRPGDGSKALRSIHPLSLTNNKKEPFTERAQNIIPIKKKKLARDPFQLIGKVRPQQQKTWGMSQQQEETRRMPTYRSARRRLKTAAGPRTAESWPGGPAGLPYGW